ncbi:MAG: imidazole glycerol phosphate synthase subunit HisH [Dongiaceae bacterium]
MNIVVVDYGSGNLRSAAKALEHVADAASHVQISDKAADVRAADRIVLPGVGAFADCKAGLGSLPGMIEALRDTVIEKQRPFLGLCVGMQLMARAGHEHVMTEGLNWIGGEVVSIAPRDAATGAALKVPHMGWNALSFDNPRHPLLAGIDAGDEVYFVHSFQLRLDDLEDRLAATDYGGAITAMIARDNMAGTQFHPEKSQRIGLALLANFLGWKP